ncbi:glycosyltransferase family 4 protein [Aurantibacillus circumpalustris]|uniref:glycosyltransferase family 4 protein n=1 Tax=Aurantibacillus circumpalustris TaxID=3036359 RepID=UPI00295A9FAA|nr:glycosyltransferase family 4 protein [Aurantibacillus circumpalustris]
MSSNSVLFLTYWYPNKNNKSFGIFVKRHAHAANLYINTVVLSLNIAKGSSFFEKNIIVFKDEKGVETHQIDLNSKYYKLLYVLLPLHYFILKRYLKLTLNKQHTFDTIHSNVIFPCGIVGQKLATKFGLKHVITEHWTKIDKFFRVSLYSYSGKKVLNKANALTCVSQQLKDTLKTHTINHKISIIPNVIESSEFYYDPTINKNDVFTFIAVANWGQHKNPFYFLDALQELLITEKITNFKVVLIGDGEQTEKIRKKKYDFQIEFKGIIASKEVKTELSKSHIFLHGSDFETFSIVMAEALMCGLPSVLSPVGIAKDVINKDNGFVTNNTVSDWKEKIYLCYTTKYDNQLISEQLKNKFDLKAVGTQFKKLYEDL